MVSEPPLLLQEAHAFEQAVSSLQFPFSQWRVTIIF